MDMLSRRSLRVAAAYLRHAPVETGKWRLIGHFLPRLRADGPTLGERLVRTRYGFRFKADLSDWLGQYVYLTGSYEPPTARVIHALLRPGDTFIDIGANSGFFTLLASLRVAPGGRVLAFEPVPSMRKRLRANLSLNGTKNVVVHDVALSNKAGECVFHEGPAGHKGLSSLRPLENEARSFAVRTLPLDDIPIPAGATRLIKIDVEGAEQLVVDGMRRLLERDRPNVVLEVTDRYLSAFGHGAVGLCGSLCEMGYRMHHIKDDGLVPMGPEDANAIAQYNALFTRGSLPANLR